MKITKAVYIETVEILVLGASRWRKAGFEAELGEDEDAVLASIELKKKVDEVHKQNNIDVDVFSPPIPPVKIADTIERAAFRKKLDKCKTIADLNIFNKEAKGMRDIFNDRLNKLSEK